MLSASDYHGGYFHRREFVNQIRGGYSLYRRWVSTDDSRMTEGRTSTGEMWRDRAIEAVHRYKLVGKKVLEIGCAFGFMVEDMVEQGVDAYGLDVSAYAINECQGGADFEAAATVRRPDLASRFYLGDARTALARFTRNEFDVVTSFRFMECIPDADLPGLISEMNRIGRSQVHVIDEFTGENSTAAIDYNAKPIEDWLAMDWAKGTRLFARERETDEKVK